MKEKQPLLCIFFSVLLFSLTLFVCAKTVFAEELTSKRSMERIFFEQPPYESGDWLYYDNSRYNRDNIVVCGYTGNDEHVIIPETIDGKIVRELALAVYRGNVNDFFRYEGEIAVKRITIPDTVETIDDYTFYNCPFLKQADLPKELKVIGRNALALCSGLKKADIPDNVKRIEEGAFEGTAITKAELPDTVTALGERVFRDCEELQTARLPSGITRIPTELFSGCVSLRSAEISDKAVYIGGNAFQNCAVLEEIYLPQSLEEISTEAFRGCGSLTSLEIPDNVQNIREYAFADCVSLESLKLPKGISEIAEGLFVNCRSLKLIEIPEGVKEIRQKEDVKPFEGCDSLQEIHFPKSIGSVYGILKSNKALKAVYFDTDREIAEAVIGADIISVMSVGDRETDYSKVELHFKETPASEAPQKNSHLNNIKKVLRITSAVFTLTFLFLLAITLIQKSKASSVKINAYGNSLTGLGTYDTVICKSCGMSSGKEVRYCINCGKKLPHKKSKK